MTLDTNPGAAAKWNLRPAYDIAFCIFSDGTMAQE